LQLGIRTNPYESGFIEDTSYDMNDYEDEWVHFQIYVKWGNGTGVYTAWFNNDQVYTIANLHNDPRGYSAWDTQNLYFAQGSNPPTVNVEFYTDTTTPSGQCWMDDFVVATEKVTEEYGVGVIEEEPHGKIFQGNTYFSAVGGQAPLSGVKINGSETDVSGYYVRENLTYNVVYPFLVEPPSGYYPAWCLNVDGNFSWDGTQYVLSHNVTNQMGYIELHFQETSDFYIKQSNAKLTHVSFNSYQAWITGNDAGTKTIVVNVGDRGKPDLISGASWVYDAPLLTLTVVFGSSKTVYLEWETVPPELGITVYFQTQESLGFQCGTKTVVLLVTVGNLNSSNIAVSMENTGGSFRFEANESVTIKITFDIDTVKVSGDKGHAFRGISSGSSFPIDAYDVVVIQWNFGAFLLLPIKFILGMVGLASMSGGSIYAVQQIKHKEYYEGFRSGAIFISIGFAFFLAWLW